MVLNLRGYLRSFKQPPPPLEKGGWTQDFAPTSRALQHLLQALAGLMTVGGWGGALIPGWEADPVGNHSQRRKAAPGRARKGYGLRVLFVLRGLCSGSLRTQAGEHASRWACLQRTALLPGELSPARGPPRFGDTQMRPRPRSGPRLQRPGTRGLSGARTTRRRGGLVALEGQDPSPSTGLVQAALAGGPGGGGVSLPARGEGVRVSTSASPPPPPAQVVPVPAQVRRGPWKTPLPISNSPFQV